MNIWEARTHIRRARKKNLFTFFLVKERAADYNDVK